MTDDNESPVIPIGTTNFEPGMHEGVAMATYLDDPAVSASRLWKLHEETPAHLHAELVDEAENGRDDSTKAQELGTVAHTAVFEADEFDSRYVVIGQCEATKGDGTRCQNAGSRWRDGQSFCGVRSHDPYGDDPMQEGIHAVQEGLKNKALAMKRRLLGYPPTGEVLRAPGQREVVVVAQDPVTGLWLRIRPDQLIEDPPVVRQIFHHSAVNLKTTGWPASPHRLPRRAENAGWQFKGTLYWMVLQWAGFDARHMLYPVVESKPPHEPIIYRLDEDALDICETEVRAALNTLAECVEKDEWPGYRPTVHKLSLSDYRLRQVHSIDFLEVDEADDETEVAA